VGLEEIFAPVQEAMGGRAVCRFVGPNDADNNTAPPFISWQPVQAKHLPPSRLRGVAGDPGAILTRQWAIRVDVWGKDLGNAVELADLFLATAHDLLSQHSYGPGEEQWNPGGVTAHGCHCLMTLFISTPILRTASPTQTIGEIRAAMKLNGTTEFTQENTEP
jgi:hypothetical protein